VAWLFSIRWWEGGGTSAAHGSAHIELSLRRSLPLLCNRRIAGIFLGYFANDYAWYLLLRWMPVYLSVERKFGAREMALANSLPFVLVVFLIIPVGIASDLLVRQGWNEVRVRKAFITAGMFIACLIVPSALVQNKTTCAWLLAMAICGLGSVAPNAWLLTQAICPKSLVGTATGIQNFGGNLAGIVVPALTGLIAHRTGTSVWAFSLAGLILLAGVVCYWILIPENLSDTLAQAK